MGKKCKNCGTELTDRYCPHCGQKASTARITMSYFFKELEYSLTHADRRGIFFTVKELFTRPGHMLRDYLLGHRVNYFRPFPLLVVLATFYGVLMHFVLPETESSWTADNQQFVRDLEIAGSFWEQLYRLANHMVHSYVFEAIVVLPFFAQAMKWAFRRSGSKRYNYAECLYVSAYLACQRLAVTFLFWPWTYLHETGVTDTYGRFWRLLTYFALTVWAFKQFFNIGVKKAIGRTLLVGFFMFLLVLATAVITALLVVIPLAFYTGKL